ncbi:helix-turn-helix domain-containing protein [Micromonospora sp. CB01531]|uniref:helix-turn-helix domain-containing protein n=1 Tax=Micromonospora sp. CB01531 TaxID=1718947 RepID=UPI000A55E95F|nr:helix-turn-helix domain-containing protein [Micromonospora sp. CB01531]
MTDPLADEARRLRVEEQLSVRAICARLGIGRDRASALLRGVPPPEWTRRPNAKDALRAEAVRLRAGGRSVNEIAQQLGVAKSTAYQWVKHLPLDPDDAAAQRRRARSKLMTDARWSAHREARDAAQAAEQSRGAAAVGTLDERDLCSLGRRSTGVRTPSRSPWRRDDHLQFINSDPGIIAPFLRLLAACGIDRGVPTYRVSIHESADAAAAVRWWMERLGLPADRIKRSTIKRHRIVTLRWNTGDDYHGCLVINVPGSRELYWRIEGLVAELFAATRNESTSD